MSREAMQAALDAIRRAYPPSKGQARVDLSRATLALEGALAQPEQPPAAWMLLAPNGTPYTTSLDFDDECPPEFRQVPLYLAPPALAAGEARPAKEVLDWAVILLMNILDAQPGLSSTLRTSLDILAKRLSSIRWEPQPTDRSRSSETDTAKAKHGPSPERPVPNREDTAAQVAVGSGEWRKLAHQFDTHRMQALAHLRMLLEDPQGHADVARQFLAAPPQPAEPSEEQVEAAWQVLFGDTLNVEEGKLVRAALVAAMGARK